MGDAYWQGQADRQNETTYNATEETVLTTEPGAMNAEYVHMQLASGESVRFKRVWGEHRFTDSEVQRLMAGMEIRIDTRYSRGVIGSLEWQEYNGREYYGFSAWAPEAYMRHNAPMPRSWNGETITDDHETLYRLGEKVLLVCVSKKSGNEYAVNTVFDLRLNQDGELRWGIVPLFDEFNQPATDFTRMTAAFMPKFGDKRLTVREIDCVRRGGAIPYQGVGKTGRPYACMLTLELESWRGNPPRWKLKPNFG